MPHEYVTIFLLVLICILLPTTPPFSSFHAKKITLILMKKKSILFLLTKFVFLVSSPNVNRGVPTYVGLKPLTLMFSAVNLKTKTLQW